MPIPARTAWPWHPVATPDALVRLARALIGWAAPGCLAGIVLAPAPLAAQTAPDTAQPAVTPAAPPATAAQSAAPPKSAEQMLKDLIPDSAVADPEHWALDTDAAHQPVDPKTLPDVTWLNQAIAQGGTASTSDSTMGAIPGLTIAWPDTFEVPAIVPLTPDPDIADAASTARDAGAALDVAMPRGGWRGPFGADAMVRHAAPGIDLVFPKDTNLPEMDDLVDRFVALSSLRALGHGDDNLAQLSRRARDDVTVLVQILRLYGYYDADISQNMAAVTAPGDGGAPASDQGKGHGGLEGTVRFEIVPGVRYRIGAIDLGEIARSPDKSALINALALKSGDPANTETIIAARTRLIDELGHIGYAFAKVGDPALAVDHAVQQADLTLPVTTGGKYVFGQVVSSLPDFLNSRHLQRIARFRKGRIYDQRLVDDFRQALLSTGIVGGVKITPREVTAPTPAAPGMADLDVKLVKGPQHSITGALGQSDGQGFFVEGSWEDRNFFPPEGMIRLRGVLGTREELAGITFRRSNFMARDTALNADLYAQVQNTDAYDAHTLSAILSLEKQSTLIFQKTWAWSAGVEVIATKELATGLPVGTPYTPYFIGALPTKLAFDGSNNLLDPTRGVRIAVTVQPAISIQDGPRSSYVLTQLDASTYQQVSSALVLAERIRVAAINGTGIVNIAPSQRLYAGGGASIRGYGYQEVGPKDSNNNPIGGLSLSEFSLEARVRTGLFDGAFSVVPFLDGGMVGTTPTPTMRGAKFGAGIGVRYKTTFGPIRIDVGTPLNPSPGDSRIGVYIALGQAF
jgi:translocation and assembly module TamA